MRKKLSRGWIVLVLLAALLPVSGWAQSGRGTLSGTVTDPTGAVVPGVELTLKAVATGTEARSKTGPDGLYTFPNVQTGIYELKASAQGFREFVQKGIEITLNATLRADVKLELGAETQTIEVVENALNKARV